MIDWTPWQTVALIGVVLGSGVATIFIVYGLPVVLFFLENWRDDRQWEKWRKRRKHR